MLPTIANRDNVCRIPSYDYMEAAILDEAAQADSERDALPYVPGMLEERA